MFITIRQIADSLSATAHGDGGLAVNRLSEPQTAECGDLALAMTPKYLEAVKSGRAQAAVVPVGTDWKPLGLKAVVEVKQPDLAFSQITALFATLLRKEPEIHPLSVIAADASIAEDVSVGAFTVIGKNVKIGRGSRVSSNCTIEENTCIGEDSIIHPGVRIGRCVTIGDRLIVHSNAVIGSDGFSFADEGENQINLVRRTLKSVDGGTNSRPVKIHSLGTVRIGNDVEIGAGVAIDRGTIAATEIGDGTKIDNNVHVAHNVQIGRDCRICGLTGIAGSAKVGDRVVLGGMTGVSDHVQIGDDVLAAGASKIYSRVRASRAVMGSPAVEMSESIKINKCLRRLPRILERLSALESILLKRREDD